jgi:hypothetical protein
MKIINRRLHALLDYTSAFILLSAPWLFQFKDSNTATIVAIAAGATILVLSTITDYEGSLFRLVPMSAHLNLDILLGILLAASPWIFGFNAEVYLPHLLMGVFAVLSGLLTVRRSLSKTGVR